MEDNFIQKYRDLHEELYSIEKEIENYINSGSNICMEVVDGLKKRALIAIDLLEKTRAEERKIFNYEK
jgi:hypothetical protein